MKRLCVIPAREGSKRIPRKNIKDFCGKPMIAHAIEAAKASGIFDVIHVSTDSDDIAKVAEELGHKPDFARPSDLAGDHTSMMEVIKHVVEEYKNQGTTFDTVTLIYATSPLVSPEDLNNACTKFEQGDGEKALLAVAPYPAPIEQAFIMNPDDSDDLTPDSAEGLATRTQDLKKSYYDAGMFCFYTSHYVLDKSGAGDFNSFRGFVVPSWRVTDIDWPDDWEHAERLYKAATSN